MKRKLLTVISSFIVILIGGYTVYSSQMDKELTDLVLTNVEALAGYESPDVEITCNGSKHTPPGRCWLANRDCVIGGILRPEDCGFTGYLSHYCVTPCD